MAARGMYHCDLEGWPAFPFEHRQAYPRVWQKAANAALERLRRGDWIAQGISPAYGPEPRRIATDLWDYLQLLDRLEEAKGAGFRFVALTISEVRRPTLLAAEVDKDLPRTQPASFATLRERCIELFERLDKELPLTASKKVFFREARAQVDPDLKDYLLKKAWQAAELDPQRSEPGVRPVDR